MGRAPKSQQPKRHRYCKTLDELAALLGMSRRTLADWQRDGIIAPTSGGRWSSKEVLAIAQARAEAAESVASPESEDGEFWKTERAKWQAKSEELKYYELQGSLISRDDVDQAQTAKILVLKNSLLGLGSQLAPRLLGLKDKREIERIIEGKLVELIEQYASAPDVEEDGDEEEG